MVLKNKILLLILILFSTTQGVFAVQESLGKSTPLDEPAFEDLAKPYFVPKSQLDLQREELELKKQQEYEQLHPIEDMTPKGYAKRSVKPLKKVRLKLRASFDKLTDQEKKDAQIETSGKTKEEVPTEQQNRLVLECKTMNYLADKKEIHALGGAKLIFPAQNTVVTADTMIYNQSENLIKLIDNVVINRDNNLMTGDYMQIDLNEEIGIMDNIQTSNYSIEMVAEKGFMYGDKTIQENGHLKVTHPFNIRVFGAISGMNNTLNIDEEDEFTYDDIMHNSKFVIKSSHIIVDSKENLDKVTLKKIELYKNGKRVLKLPSTTFYSNKAQDFVEGNFPEAGSRPRMGAFVGPGMVLETPKGTTLKLIPFLNYKSGLGIGGMARFRSASNMTEAAYGSASELFTLRGFQDLDDNLYLQYGVNSYLANGMLGRGWSKYNIEMIYRKNSRIKSFLGEEKPLDFNQRFSIGYIQDGDLDKAYDKSNKAMYDKNHRPIRSLNIGTMRFNYQTQLSQTLFDYKNYEDMKFADFGLVSQTSVSAYGTGDTQFVVRIGPRLKTQYKYWSQELGYYLAGYSNHTPLVIYDSYRYGHSNVYIRESLRLHRLLRLGWLGSINLSGDSPNGKLFQECKFLVDIGPDDMRLQVGTDAIRQNTYVGFVVDIDAKGTEVYYDKLEVKNAENFGKNAQRDEKKETAYKPVSNKKVKGKQAKSNVVMQSQVQKCEVVDVVDSSLKMEGEL